MSVIAHPISGKPELDRVAHEHAVLLAAVSGSKLLSLHADAGHLEHAPLRAAELLRRWGRDPAEVEHELRSHESQDDPVNTVLAQLANIQADLVVMATAQHKGALRVLFESRAEAIAAGLDIPALIVPLKADGFVQPNGDLKLDRILVPVGDERTAAVEIERTAWFVDLARLESVEAELLHVGDGSKQPDLGEVPDHPRITWTRRDCVGGLEDTIVEASRRADLLVMATRGHDSLIDLVLGSHTERVLRRLECPLLIVPVSG